MFDALNHEIGLATRSNSANGTNGRETPYAANYQLCEMSMPAGENYCIGSPYINLTNESYNFNYNSHGIHFISRINGDGTCEIVYFGCLQFSPEPQHYIAPFRVFMRRELICPNRDGKYLCWLDGTDFGIGHLDVEAAIATNNFTTSFFKRCSPDPCDFVRLCVPEICDCIYAEFIPLPSNEIGLSNNMLNRGFKFMVKHVYYDGRESEWSSWSKLYYQVTEACAANTNGLPRCIKLRIPVGNAMVEKLKIAFSEDGGLTWYVTETVEKYKKYNDLQEKWYERDLAELPNFSEHDCAFDYIFCNNKERVQVPSSELTRLRNPIPREGQGFLQVKDAIGVFNYKDGVCPVDKKEIEKIKIGINCDDPTNNNCNPEFVTVTVRALVHSFPRSANRYIFRYAGGVIYTDDDPTDQAYYGGTGYPFQTYLSKQFGQTFNGKTRNFIAYVDGSDYWGEMKQWQSAPYYKDTKQVGVLANQGDNGSMDYLNIQIRNGNFFYQEAKIKVLKGTRGFLRLANQSETSGLDTSQNTSTSVTAILDNMSNYVGIDMPVSHFDFKRKEIYFDTCNGDVDLTEAFIIMDLADQEDIYHSIAVSSYAGYIKDKNGNPVEGLVLHATNGADFDFFTATDHNGYYFFSKSDTDTAVITFSGELSCSGFTVLQTETLTGADGKVSLKNITINNDSYKDNFYLKVEQKLLDCDGNPVPGIKIAIGGSKYKITDANGIAHLRMRNYITRNRIIHTVVMNVNGCFTLDCNNQCSPCMPSIISNAIPCYNATPQYLMANMVINKKGLLSLSNGLKAGGRYPFAVVPQGNCGRQSASYLIKYLDIPRTQEKNKLGFCNLTYDFGDSVYPDWVNCIKIVRGQNENPYPLQWVIDKKEYIGDNKLKLTIQSLNDYNQKYFYQANTIYQWLKGDRIEFIRNGDGKILTTALNGLLNYLTISPFHDKLISGLPNADANYFNQLIIEDDGRLKDITEGSIIEVQRPKTSTGETIFYDICVNITVINGIPAIKSGSFTTYDTYIVSRTAGSFLGYFESHYPSDFWGRTLGADGIAIPFDDTGKRYIANQYETEKRYGQNISINSSGVFNHFGDIIKTICPKVHGDITGMGIWDGRVIIGIGEHDNFLAQSADDLLRVGNDGIIRALPADAVISDAQPKVRGQFGCQYDSIGSIYFGDGYAKWVDKNRDADVKHDFNEAVDVSMGRAQTFFRKKCREMDHVNSTVTNPLDKLRFIVGYNQLSGAIMTTIKSLRQPGVNNSFGPYLQPNVTICYHPVADIYLTRAAFTPESYSLINLTDDGGCAFVAVLNGVPYIHPKISDKYLEYFGISCDWAFGQSVNQYPEKDKTPLAFEIQSTTKWFVSEVTTENINFRSEIPAVKVKRDKDKWNSAFLKNINSRGGLFSGDLARGYFVKVMFVRDNTNNDLYGTFDNNKRHAYSELGSVFFKFRLNEQTGYTENV